MFTQVDISKASLPQETNQMIIAKLPVYKVCHLRILLGSARLPHLCLEDNESSMKSEGIS